MRRRGIETDSSHLDSRECRHRKTQTHVPQTHNQGRLEHFKDKHVFSCGLIKLKVNASDAGLALELPGN